MHRSALFLALALAFTTQVQAASHREAPITALDQKADITDVFAFRSYDGNPTPKVTLNSGRRSVSGAGEWPELVPV